MFPKSKSPTLAQARTLQACSSGPCLARQAVPVLLGGDVEEQAQGQVEEVQAGHGHQEAGRQEHSPAPSSTAQKGWALPLTAMGRVTLNVVNNPPASACIQLTARAT